jgi:endonuclease YncB( thermonuclease family)
MNLRSRTTRFAISFAAALSLIAGGVAVPATAASSTGVSVAAGISAKKKVLTTEQKNAKKALDKAVADLKAKEKALAKAAKAQAKALKDVRSAEKKLKSAKSKAAKKPTKKNKAEVRKAAANLKKAQAKHASFSTKVVRLDVVRDTTQAKVVRADAKYAWLINDISKLQCGVGDQIVTASGAVETVRECGIVYKHEDGDTTHVKTTRNQLVEVRNIGLQTPERKKGSNAPQCGAEQAYQHFMGLMPEEITIVQLRSLTDSSNGWGGGSRPTRSVYKLNNATGAFDIDVQAEQIKAGWSLWWPTGAEWANNKTYLDLMNDAKARGVGIWNPNLCGPAVGNVPLMWFNQNAPTIDGNTEPAFGEYVILYNNTGSRMDLTNWSLRDNSLNFFWSSSRGWMQGLNKFGSFELQSGEHRIVYLDNPDNYPLSASEYRYFNWGHSPGAQLTNGSVSASFSPNYANGDGIYLQDTYGNIRASMTNPCTSSAMCETPAWVNEILSSSRPGQIIPVPVALNKVANSTRDIYNPVVSIASGALATATKAALTTAGFTAVDGNAFDSPLAAGTTLAVTDAGTFTGSNSIVGQRRAIADLPGTTRTTLYVHAASGSNTLPDLDGMTEADARIATTNAGFRIGTVTTEAATGAAVVGAVKVDSQSVVPGRTTVGQTVNFTVYTAPVVP